MLRTLVIGVPPDQAETTKQTLEQTGYFNVLRVVPHYPAGAQLERLVHAYAPEVIFLNVGHLQQALAVRAVLEKLVRGLPVVAFDWEADPETLLQLMKAGVREFEQLPWDRDRLIELGRRLREHIAHNPFELEATDLLFTFLPAKPGVGTTTVAVNLSVAMSRLPGTRVLLLDFDLNTGLVAFMLQLGTLHSVVDAAENSDRLDHELWSQLVSKVGNLDVLPSGRGHIGRRIESVQILRLLSFARRAYTVICADLSGNLEKYSIELMQESKRIFLVTTPEIAPLHLARERIVLLRSLELGDRISLIVNRWVKRSVISLDQIEDVLEVPVFAVFPNDYRGVHEAVSAGKPIPPDSPLGKEFEAVARRILKPELPSEQPKRRFFDTFSVLPSLLSQKR